MNPSIGRTVHYVAYGTPGGEFPAGVCRAAVITTVDPPTARQHGAGPMETVPDPVGLCVVNPTGLFFNLHVPYSNTHQPGTWHWPERLEE